MRIAFLPIILLFIACSGKESYSVTGTIIEVRNESNEFLIHHDEIPGFMMAMTMPFKLADSTDISQFQTGDSLKFRLVMEGKRAFAKDFILLGKGTIPDREDMWSDEFTPLEIGEVFDDVTFLDLDSNEVSLSDSDGKFRLISYIFTRCPMPEMCPAVVVKNQYLAQEFKEREDMSFILVSFDYKYDTPRLLKQTYGSLIEHNPGIEVWSSTDHVSDIFTLAGQSFVSFWGVDENDIGHTLRSVLLDPERRLLKVYEGTIWRPEVAAKDIRNILQAYSL